MEGASSTGLSYTDDESERKEERMSSTGKGDSGGPMIDPQNNCIWGTVIGGKMIAENTDETHYTYLLGPGLFDFFHDRGFLWKRIKIPQFWKLRKCCRWTGAEY